MNSISFERLLWLVPIFFALHNMEEAPFMERWSKRLPFKVPVSYSTRQFVIAVIILTVGGFLLAYWGIEYLHNTTGYLIVLGIQAILFFNAFLPHIGSTILFRMYSPGVVSATLITVPFSIYICQRALLENIITWKQIWILLAIAPFAMVLFAVIALQMGKVIGKQ
ncbi:MAG: HXXEE domain-containing protein [Anaerolineales bacterium]